MKVLWLQHRISASVITNALVIAFVDGQLVVQLKTLVGIMGILFGAKVKTFLLPPTGHDITLLKPALK